MGGPWPSWCRRTSRGERVFRTWPRFVAACPSSIRRYRRPSARIAKIASRRRRPARIAERRAGYTAMLPAPLYCDTSALLKLYLRESGSEEFNALTEGRDDVLVSELTVTEAVSALARHLRQGSITREAVGRIRHAIVRGLDDGRCRRAELTPEVHSRAQHV